MKILRFAAELPPVAADDGAAWTSDAVQAAIGALETACCLAPPGTWVELDAPEGGALVAVIQGTMVADGDREEAGALVAGDLLVRDRTIEDRRRTVGEDSARLVRLVWPVAKPAPAPAQAPVFVISMPPTPNGDLHLGHVSGPYLGADVHVRFLRMRGLRAYHLSGSDDNQSYVEAKAAQLGATRLEVAAEYSAQICATLDALGMTPDYFTRPFSDPGYEDHVRRFFLDLIQKGVITLVNQPVVLGKVSGDYYCEYMLKGLCPICGAETSGNVCEECAQPNLCSDILEARSTGGEPLVAAAMSLWSINLPEHAAMLRRFHAGASLNGRLRGLLAAVLTRVGQMPVILPTPWGIDADRPETPGHRIWAWAEMVAGFLFGIEQIRRRAGLAPDATLADGRVVIFLGVDNAPYDTILHPPLFAAAIGREDPPIDYVCNEFYRLDGQKFSTSRGHAIWGREILAQAEADEVRYYLAWTRPEGRRTDFTRLDFRAFLDRQLAPWDRALSLAADFSDRFPRVVDTGAWTLEQQAFAQRIAQIPAELARCYSVTGYSLRQAARRLQSFVEETAEFAAAERCWMEVAAERTEARTAYALTLAALRSIALLAAPLTPDFAQRLWAGLGETGLVSSARWPSDLEFVAPGSQVRLRGLRFAATRRG